MFADVFPRSYYAKYSCISIFKDVVYPYANDSNSAYNHSAIAYKALGINGHSAHPQLLSEIVERHREVFDCILFSSEDFCVDVVNGFSSLNINLSTGDELYFLVGFRPISLRAPGLLQELLLNDPSFIYSEGESLLKVLNHGAGRLDYCAPLARSFPNAKICILNISSLSHAIYKFFDEQLYIQIPEDLRLNLENKFIHPNINQRLDGRLISILSDIKRHDLFSNPSNWGIGKNLLKKFFLNYIKNLNTVSVPHTLSQSEQDFLFLMDQYQLEIFNSIIDSNSNMFFYE